MFSSNSNRNIACQYFGMMRVFLYLFGCSSRIRNVPYFFFRYFDIFTTDISIFTTIEYIIQKNTFIQYATETIVKLFINFTLNVVKYTFKHKH